jgi:hypothetical protein
MISYPAPQTPRQLFQLCRFYDRDQGIRSISERVGDWSAVTPRQVYAAVLGRLPESSALATPAARYRARDHFEEALRSSEFQEQLIPLISDAFPEKRRVVFIHIPRTAGTDLEINFERRAPLLHHRLTVPEETPTDLLFETLRELAHSVDLREEIFISGHIQLKWYVDHRICRFTDRVFTVIREPVDLLVSWTNYVLTVLLDIRDSSRFDRKGWLRDLGIATLPTQVNPQDRLELAVNILRNETIVGRDWLCSYLGTGTAESALELLAICNVEVTHLQHYSHWLWDQWHLETNTRAMQATPTLSRHSISRQDYDYLYERTREDQILYKRVVDAIAASGTLSVNGMALAMAYKA